MAKRFGLVGLAATAIHMSVVWVLLRHSMLGPVVANAVAFLTAFGFSFSAHFLWTFESSAPVVRAMCRFFAVSVSAFALNTLILEILVHGTDVSPAVCALLSALVVPVFSFLASRYWAFRRAGSSE